MRVRRCYSRKALGFLGALSFDNLSFRLGRRSVTSVSKDVALGDIVEVGFIDPSNPGDTNGALYFGDPKLVIEEAVWDGEGLSSAARKAKIAGCDKIAVWQHIYIAESERKSGVGRKIVNNVLSFLAAAGVRHVFLQAQESEGFWRRVGFADTGYKNDGDPVMHREIGRR